jgi:hypothetical protein
MSNYGALGADQLVRPNNDVGNGLTGEPAAASGGEDCCGCCLKMRVEKVQGVFRFVSIVNGMCIAFVGIMDIFAWGTCSSTHCCLTWNTFSKMFLPVYTVAAGFLLAVAEMRLAACHTNLSSNCGFLFSYNLRVLFILLAGTLCFCMECGAFSYVGYLAGSYSMCNALFSCFMISNHPGMVELTGHDEIDEARKLQQYGFNSQPLVASNAPSQDPFGSGEKPYEMTPTKTNDGEGGNPFVSSSMASNSNMSSSTGLLHNDISDGLQQHKRVESDPYLNPFAADNTL